MTDLVIRIGSFTMRARYELELAPKTCEAFRKMLPMQTHVLHVRWSGQAVWVPMGELKLPVPPENATSYPVPGEILLYPGGVSETELLIAYGGTRFASKAGQLAGNHFLTLTSGNEHLKELGRLTLWHGAQQIRIEAA